MNVMLLGATGLTGRKVLERLVKLEAVNSVVAPVRRTLCYEHPKFTPVIVDFDQLAAQESLFQVDAIVCCLGTTIKQAGSRERFREVDYDYAYAAAELGRKQGARAFILMSAIGASPSSLVFYNRVKGELEDSVRALNYPYLSIYQPGLLMAERQEQRLLEGVGMAVMRGVNPLMMGPMKAYRGIDPDLIAQAMANEIELLATPERQQSLTGGRRSYEDIVTLARC